MTDTSFWQRAIPVPTAPRTAGEEYRAMNYGTSLPENWVAAYHGKPQANTSHYEQVTAKTLDDYASAPRASKWAWDRDHETAVQFLGRTGAVLRHPDTVTADELEQVKADRTEALAERDGGQTHEQLRGQIDAAGATAGLFGSQTAAAQMRSDLDQRTAAATSALRTGVAYQPTSPGVPRVDIAGVLKAEAHARGAAVAARYAHENLRPSAV